MSCSISLCPGSGSFPPSLAAAWEAVVLPLNYARVIKTFSLSLGKTFVLFLLGPFNSEVQRRKIFGVKEEPHEKFDSRVSFWDGVQVILDPLDLGINTIERSEPFGKYCLNRPLVCSLRPRSHE